MIASLEQLQRDQGHGSDTEPVKQTANFNGHPVGNTGLPKQRNEEVLDRTQTGLLVESADYSIDMREGSYNFKRRLQSPEKMPVARGNDPVDMTLNSQTIMQRSNTPDPGAIEGRSPAKSNIMRGILDSRHIRSQINMLSSKR